MSLPATLVESYKRAGEKLAHRKPVRAAMTAVAIVRDTPEPSERNRAMLDGISAGLLSNGRCLKCGRELSDPDSLARGIGPDCLNEFGGDEAWMHYVNAVTGNVR